MGTTPRSELRGMRVVAAYPQGSADIESSVSRVPEYTQAMQEMGVTIVDSIDQLVLRSTQCCWNRMMADRISSRPCR